MNYIEIDININPFSLEISEILMAELAEVGFESFSEYDYGLKAYVQEKLFNREKTVEIIVADRFQGINLSHKELLIMEQNWNTLWESNFEPITIGKKILVKAPFHTIEENFEHSIIIEPKMSFGTGHHETTSLMMELMLTIPFENANVLDMGCGTGILSILAFQLNAKTITAIDFDEWAFENTKENIERNKCSAIKSILGDASAIPNQQFEIILANINRNVLIADIPNYNKHLKNGGLLLLSGFYETDIDVIETITTDNSLHRINYKEKNNWVSCLYKKE
jgi:ribosomal protein L11 methyltransferase